nr:hypothetical protein [uncultured Dyadobacter sp.]
MYNLFVSADENDWQGELFEIGIDRCIRQYTDLEIRNRFCELDEESINTLRSYPCIFAYESRCKLAAKFGWIKNVKRRKELVRIEYEVIENAQILSHSDLGSLRFELDIDKLELNRTHWAVKEVNLVQELANKGINLTFGPLTLPSKIVDVTQHIFEVALSFPGEIRHLVEPIARGIQHEIGPDTCFYDNDYKAQLARPSLNLVLQDIYLNRSKLVVVFLSADYQRKEWCGVEFRAIQEILLDKKLHSRVMFFRTDNALVDGVFRTDGFIDCNEHTTAEIVNFIKQRIQLAKA